MSTQSDAQRQRRAGRACCAAGRWENVATALIGSASSC